MARRRRKIIFRKYGQSYHLQIKSADDLLNVLELDEAHWIATGAPIQSFNCDKTFLTLVDTDNNQRIMCYEVKNAIRWLFQVLKNTQGITEKSDVLAIEAINAEDDEGAKIYKAANKIIERVGSFDNKNAISLKQVRELKSAIESLSVSEIGVVLAKSADDEALRQFISDVITVTGGTEHPSGERGITQRQLDDFISYAKAWLEWTELGKIPEGKSTTQIMPFGIRTERAYHIFKKLCNKIDEYFIQCQIVFVNPETRQKFMLTPSFLNNEEINNTRQLYKILEKAPLAEPNTEQKLKFDDKLNPYYKKDLSELVELVLKSISNGENVTELSFDDWNKIKQMFVAYEDWLASKPEISMAELGEDRLREYLKPEYYQRVSQLITERKETTIVLENIRLTEKAILYQAYLLDFANNFVSFPYLYDINKRAMFEMGTLIMDGRKFMFSIKVDNIDEHSKVASQSNIFVLYLDILIPDNNHKYQIAVPVTSGDKGNLSVGKRGVFQDVLGREFDAIIIRIVENPISIREALFSPFNRAAKMITGKIESITASAEKKLDTATEKLTSTIESAVTSSGNVPARSQVSASGGLLTGGILMGGGVAIAAIGTAATYAIKTLINIGPYKLALGFIGLILIVAIPVSILAMLKLRRRDLSVVLEGAGWAINSPMRLTFRQGKFFTQRPQYPKGAKGIYWLRKLILAILILVVLGVIAGRYYFRLRPMSFYFDNKPVTTNKSS